MSTPDVSAAPAAQPETVEATPPPAAPAPPLEVRPETVVAATFEALKAKPRRKDEVLVPSVDETGRPVKLKLKLVAISSQEYDALVDAHPPTPKQRDQGAIYNADTFGPALLERVVVDPKIDYEGWRELWVHPDWSGGELGGVFNTALRICQGGLGVPFTGLG